MRANLSGEIIEAFVHPVDEYGKEGAGVSAENNGLKISDDTDNNQSTNNNSNNDIETLTTSAREVVSTPLSEGTMFASANENSSSCTENDPCSVENALEKIQAGDVLFLRGGVYKLSMSGLKKLALLI